MRAELKQKIDALIKNNAIVLFMKGTKEQPQCGFSKRVVEVLKKLSSDFVTVDVLSDPELREGIKVYSAWPTIPQLYIKGEFIGGCDIIMDLYQEGELPNIIGVEKASQKPHLKLTEEALGAFSKAQADCQDDEYIRLSIGADFEHDLSYDEKREDDFCLENGDVKIIMDPYSAARAQNLHIDFITEDLEAGFAFNNPNEPPPVKELSVEEFKAWSEQGRDALLIDVRPKSEWDQAHISYAKPLSELSDQELNLVKDRTLVFHCHHGGRSRRVAESFRARGFTNLYNLVGGIDAWSKKIDRNVPIY